MNKTVATLDGLSILASQPTRVVKADRTGTKRWVTQEVKDSVLAVLSIISDKDYAVSSREIYDVWCSVNPHGDSRMTTSTITSILQDSPRVNCFIKRQMSSTKNQYRWALV